MELQPPKYLPTPEEATMDTTCDANEDPTRPPTAIQSDFHVETNTYLPHARKKNTTNNKYLSNENQTIRITCRNSYNT